MHIIELLKNVASRNKSDHRFGISTTKLVKYIEIEPLFKVAPYNSLYMDI